MRSKGFNLTPHLALCGTQELDWSWIGVCQRIIYLTLSFAGLGVSAVEVAFSVLTSTNASRSTSRASLRRPGVYICSPHRKSFKTPVVRLYSSF